MRRLIPIVLAMMTMLAGCTLPVKLPATPRLPTPDPVNQAIVATVQATSQPATAFYASPDGQWHVEMVRFRCAPADTGDEYAYETVSLAERSGAAAIVDSQLISCGGLGAYGFDGLFWSDDSRYFYYTTARAGIPDGCGDWQPPVRRVDTAAGTSAAVGADVATDDAARLAIWLSEHQVRCAPSP